MEWINFSNTFQRVQYTGSNGLYDFQMPFLGIFSPLILFAVFFYLGQEFHSISMDLCDGIYQTDWHRHPQSIQRFILFIMMRSQRPFYLSAFGIMKLNLENFVGVCFD